MLSRRGIAWAAVAASAVVLAAVPVLVLSRDREYDPDFDTRVPDPAYRTDGPRVLYDEAHLNLHTADGRYKGFVDLIRNDGYDVHVNREAFTADRLAGASVLVIAGARGPSETENTPAFTDSEIAAVEQWVRAGGSLLLITDHYPFGAAAESLGRRLGVDIASGIVEDPVQYEPTLGHSHIIFSRANRLLQDHPITQGRNKAERIEQVTHLHRHVTPRAGGRVGISALVGRGR